MHKRALAVVETVQPRARGPDPPTQRPPEVLEVHIRRGHVELARLDVRQAGSDEQVVQLLRLAVASCALLGLARADRARRPVDRGEHLHLLDAPHADRDPVRHTTELTHRHARIVHERDDELGDCDVEAVCRKRQLLRGAS